MYDGYGNPLPSPNGKGKKRLSSIVSGCFNTQPRQPDYYEKDGTPVFLGSVREGGTATTQRQRATASRTRCLKYKIKRAAQRAV